MTLATDEAFAAAQQQSSGFILATPSAPALYGAGFGAGFGGTTAGGAFGGGGFGGGGFSGGAVGGRDTAEAHSYDLALHQIKYLLASQHFKVGASPRVVGRRGAAHCWRGREGRGVG